LFCAAAAGQTDAPVPRPEVKAGDRWTYLRMDYGRQVTRGKFELRVAFTGRDGIHAVVTEEDGRESDAAYSPEWDDLVSAAGMINVRERGELQFPLRVGATYKLAWTLENPKDVYLAGRHERTVRVVGWEAIEVPAGRFRALKVESAGSYQLSHGTFTGTVHEVFWYVPSVKRWIKRVQEVHGFGGRMWGRYDERNGEELIEFKVQ
jgi:hypothetical protein